MSDAREATGEATPPGAQLYLISPPEWDPEGLAQGLEAALSAGGIVAFRLRPAHPAHGAAQALQQICAGRVAVRSTNCGSVCVFTAGGAAKSSVFDGERRISITVG